MSRYPNPFGRFKPPKNNANLTLYVPGLIPRANDLEIA